MAQLILVTLVAGSAATCQPAHAARPGGSAGARPARAADWMTGRVDPRVTSRIPAVPSPRQARAAAQRGDLTTALAHLHALIGKARDPLLRQHFEDQVVRIVSPLAAAQLASLAKGLPTDSRVRALILVQFLQRLIAQGKERDARQLLGKAGRTLTDEERRSLRVAAGDPDTIGALVPLTGPLRVLGREILSGMTLAAGLTGRRRGRTAKLVVRDSQRAPGAAARALARQGVVAVVGVPSSANARRAAPACHASGVVLLAGADGKGVPQLGRRIFRWVHAPDQRALALARYLAQTRRIRRVAVLHPNNVYGKRAGDAFVAEVTRRGLTLVARVAYKRSETTLYKHFRPLVAKAPEAVFVADSAVRLEIIAPQLALAGLIPVPLRRVGRAGVLLLSTAEGLRQRLVKNVGHAVEGAVLAPGFFPDVSDASLASFIQSYTRTFGHAPGRYAALGYLAVLRIRTLLLRRASGRVSLAKAIANLTDAKRQRRFDAQGERIDQPRLYRVEQGTIKRFRASP